MTVNVSLTGGPAAIGCCRLIGFHVTAPAPVMVSKRRSPGRPDSTCRLRQSRRRVAVNGRALLRRSASGIGEVMVCGCCCCCTPVPLDPRSAGWTHCSVRVPGSRSVHRPVVVGETPLRWRSRYPTVGCWNCNRCRPRPAGCSWPRSPARSPSAADYQGSTPAASAPGLVVPPNVTKVQRRRLHPIHFIYAAAVET